MNRTINDLRKAGNAAVEEENYEKAIKAYSEALLVTNIGVEEKGVLHSNRSHAYLMSATKNGDDNEAKLQSALRDANEVIMVRPNWWKGYYRAGLVYKHRKEWDQAIERFDEALSLNKKLADVRKCRDECRFDKLQAEMNGDVISHGFKEEIDKVNEVYGTKIDVEHILKNYEKQLESKNPNTRAQGCVFFGARYVKGIDVPQDLEKGIGLLQEAVNIGSPEAMVELGVCYMQGMGVERNIKKAVGLFEQAAKADPKNGNAMGGEYDGIAHAQFHIGLCLENGTGKTLDHYQARCWYEKASERGHAGAANNLAILYAKGLGGEKCSTRAKQFFRLSASRGNYTAMESLAWTFLWEKDVEQAGSWYLKALESGNGHSIQNKDKFDKALEKVRLWLEKVSSETDASPEDLGKLIETIERVTNDKPTISKIEEVAGSSVGKYWNNFEEIKKRAQNGYPFAKRLLTSMSYFADSVHGFDQLSAKKVSAADIGFTQDQCISNLANCLRVTEIVVFFHPSELPRLFNLCEARISSRKSALDLDARVVHCFLLSVSQNSEFTSFARVCLQMYPDEIFFYKMQAAALALRQNFEASMKVTDEALQKFPNDECLLYCKAGAMKMIESCGKEKVIAAFKEFIKHAPFDERMIPEAYYNMSFYASDDEQDIYYQKGMEAELQMLPCLLPYQSKSKSLLDALNAFGKMSKSGVPRSATTKSTEPNLKSSAAVSSNLQVTNPARVQCVQRHRETLKKMTEMMSTKNFCASLLSITPQHEQKLATSSDGFKAITLRDMNPHKDTVYTQRLINLMICEDPMFGLLSAIHVVVRDDNDDCINCSFYDLDHYSQTVRQNLAFGSTITVLNPYYRLASDGSVALRVDHPKTIIYRECGKNNPVCRYCWKGNPQHACGSCKRVKYCSRSCQTDDWKILKHKMICGLKYFGGK
ncbi:uncharacterized protein LOC119077107 [Bradysia coprophila]|uniref:uncharacterized protein LOC119077107 n=1 Tax=Bradysia coprophila TaxID=38358 RepID=UPI00187D962C|nr:uncharacterized protein LOC119077107 [Bradysia coprophila]XP_037040162.1 uncharacterized protein LOC119077107 [Bradysia coprophila]